MDPRKRLIITTLGLPFSLLVICIVNARWQPLVTLLLVGFIVFLIGFITGSQYLFPLSNRAARIKAFDLLVSWAFEDNRPAWVFRNAKEEERIKGRQGSLTGTGLILVDASTAVVLTNGLKTTRILGPSGAANSKDLIEDKFHGSLCFPDRFEHARGAIDLRRQNRSRQVSVTTRDGIELKITLDVLFEIEREQSNRAKENPYTFTGKSVHQAIYGEGVRESQADPYSWAEAIIVAAAHCLCHLVAQYTLDQLFASDRPDDMYSNLEQEITQTLTGQPEMRHVFIRGTTIGAIEMPREVIQQKVETWRVVWENQKAFVEAQGDSESITREERARALAQAEMITSIAESLRGVEEQPAHEIVTLRLVDSIAKMVREKPTRDRLPADVQRTLSTFLPGGAEENGNE